MQKFESNVLKCSNAVERGNLHRFDSDSEGEASVSPSQIELLSSVGLMEPEEIDDEEPTVHSSVSA